MYRERGNSSTVNKRGIRITVDMYHTAIYKSQAALPQFHLTSSQTQPHLTSNTNLPLQDVLSPLDDKL
jgi:hypothetical protein